MTSTVMRPRSAADYTVACICPMGVELAPVEAMLDEIHDPLPTARDQNAYTLGRIGGHNVVIAIMPETGTNAAATVATQLLNDFPSVRLGLLVGIGGGVPGSKDIRLGDVVVSQATDTFGGVIQYDLGKRVHGQRFQRTGQLNKPPAILSAHVRKLDSQHRRRGHQLSKLLSAMIDQNPRMQDEYSLPTTAQDTLFLSSYTHFSGSTCDECDHEQIVRRSPRSRNEVYIHYGNIGSANVVVKDAALRDELHRDMNILCVEMEAAGLMNDFPCVVIRGICDYADSHKNKQWQPYAAAVAAAYMKELLLIISAQQVIQTQNALEVAESYNKHFEVPHLLSPVFTGRDETNRHLEVSFALSTGPRQPVQRRFVLFGLGGSGKTQICLRYVQTHRQRYWGIFWIDASTSDSIQQSMTQIALNFKIEPDLDSVKRALAHATQPWLLVFDNADDPNLSLNLYFPTGDRGDVIITSRNPECSQYNTVGYHEVGPMLPADSLALLTKAVCGNSCLIEEIEDGCRRIVETLGYLALAVAQAGAYIRETRCTYDDYLELYQRRRREMLAFYPKHSGTDYYHTVFTTWQVSLDQLVSMQDATSISALKMLRRLCFYHHDRIPMAMFYQAWQNSTYNDRPAGDWVTWPDALSDTFELRHVVQGSVKLLVSFSLIARDLGASLSLHPLVRDWCQHRLDENQRLRDCRHAISLLAASVAWKSGTEDYAYRRSLTSHAQACVRVYNQICGSITDEEQIDDWDTLALILSENGFTQDALRITKQVVQLYKSKLGDDHPNTIGSMHNLVIRYSEVGRSEEALLLSEQVVQLYKSKLGDDHPDTIRSMHNLANGYSEVGRYGEALLLSEQVVQLRKGKLGDDHPNTIHSMHNLAVRYSEVGRYGEALLLSKQVVQLYKSKLGDDHLDTIRSMHNLANGYSKAGRYGEALLLSEQVVQLRKGKLGDDHPDTIHSMHNLAVRYSEVGRYEEALLLSKQVVQLYKSKPGDNHPDMVKSVELLSYIKKLISEDTTTEDLAHH